MNMMVIYKQKLLGSGIDPDLHLNLRVLDLQAKVGSSGGLLVLHLDLDEGLSSLHPGLNGDWIREPGEILLQSGQKTGVFLLIVGYGERIEVHHSQIDRLQQHQKTPCPSLKRENE